MDWYELVARGIIPEPQDPRIGSGRNDSSGGGTLSAAAGNKSSSLAKLGATFGPVGAYLGLCLICFILLRPRSKRVYAPKSIPGLRGAELAPPELPSGLFNWIKPFFKIPDTYVLNYGSLDAFFFLRYMKVLRNICLAGMVIVWPILMPIHATGGNNLTQLEMLTMGNVIAGSPKLWAHAVTAWLFFGFVLYTIIRECIYFINLRQAYLSSPYYANRLSSRTMLLLCVPPEYRDEARLRKLYGDSARRIFVPRSNKTLAKLVKEREQTALRLEKAEIVLIKKANAARNKFYRKNPPSTIPPSTGSETPKNNDLSTIDSEETTRRLSGRLQTPLPGPQLLSEMDPGRTSGVEAATTQNEEEKDAEELEYVHPYGLRANLPDLRGSVAAQWIPADARPHHRPIGNWGRRVDTIRWCRTRLKELNLMIFKMRRQIRRGDGEALPAAFIEFDTQEAAVAAQQVVVHHRPLQMAPPLLYLRPEDVVWDVLRMKWWERIVRRLLIMCLISFAIVFWSIPSALIGFLSSIDFLTKIAFLKWVAKLPSFIKGLLGGFLPPALLTLLMSIVPSMLRFCAAQAGIPSLIVGELFTQNAYFAFQVIQVFLITTLTSAASSTLQNLIQDPLGAQKVLAKNLPKASNFYLSYILIQCLAIGATGLLQVFSLLRHHIIARTTDIPRSKYDRWRKLKPALWGGIYPVFTNLGVIALSYACIAPLILIFYTGLDSKGLFYPRALQQLIVGLYLAEVCLVGLLGLSKAYGAMGLTIALLIFTVLIHLNLREAIAPLARSLPQTLSIEEEIQEEERAKAARAKEDAANGVQPAGAAATYYDVEEAFGDEEVELEETDEEEHVVVSNRAVEGANSVGSAIKEWLTIRAKDKAKNDAEEGGLMMVLNKLRAWTQKSSVDKPPGFLSKWLHPAEHEDFVALRKLLPKEDHPDIVYPENNHYCTYQPPELWKPKPTLWIPKDQGRVSRQEVAQTRLSIPISDHGAVLDSNGIIHSDLDAAPFDEPKFLL
ncbi:hypothetical protein PT974_11171 [Cladobotryum mycophilum]|uniref:DUF221-domain-containing protein n=1 Tax=Cladobotryum mycophilum TaxID=491253 RepID=A0ABR0S4G5_9HYPO